MTTVVSAMSSESSSYASSSTAYGTSYGSERHHGASPDRSRFYGGYHHAERQALPQSSQPRGGALNGGVGSSRIVMNGRDDLNLSKSLSAPLSDFHAPFSGYHGGSTSSYPSYYADGGVGGAAAGGREDLTASPFGTTFWNSELDGRGNSVLRSAILMVCATFSASQLVQPYTCSLVGLVPFLLLNILAALASDAAAVLLVDLCEATSVTSYEALGFRIWGKGGAVLVAVIVVLQAVLSLSGSIYVFGTTVGPTIARWINPAATDHTSAIFCMLGATVFIIPLSLLRRLRRMKIAFSLACFLTVLCFSGLVVWQWTSQDGGGLASMCPSNASSFTTTTTTTTTRSRNNYSNNMDDELSVVGVAVSSPPDATTVPALEFQRITLQHLAVVLPSIVSSTVFHSILLPLYHETRGSRRQGAKRRNTVRATRIGVFLTFVVNSLVGVFGFLRYSDYVQPNYLDSLHCTTREDTLEARLLNLLFGLAMLVVAPLTLFAAKKALICTLIPAIRCKSLDPALRHGIGSTDRISDAEAPSTTMHFIVSLLLCGAVGIGGTYLPSILDEVIIVGSTSAVMLVFVLPSLFFLKMHGMCARDVYGRVASFSCKRLLALLLLGGGVALLVTSLVGFFVTP
jgi:hypothetical protein